MKLIIDIPDEDYKFIKDLQGLIIGGRGNCKTIQKNVINAIRNGTPYNPSGDLISREDLKEAFKNTVLPYAFVEQIIDNAPTVEYPFYQEAYQTGYEEGKNERPQGKWIKIFENPFTNGYVCPFCGHKIQVTEQFLPKVTECEVCGAEMKGGAE